MFLKQNLSTRQQIIVFDIGGTWFRRAVFDVDKGLLEVERTPALSFISAPELTIQDLQEGLLSYLISEARLLRSSFLRGELRNVSISMGAALNAHTGFIYNDGPLWGPISLPLDLSGRLNELAPDFEWIVCNDVTAALLRHVIEIEWSDPHRLTLVTVSTGIAARTYDFATRAVPTDKSFGLQGEIGHIPIHFSFRGERIQRFCDCGGANHLNAFSSGRALETLAPYLVNRFREDSKQSQITRTVKSSHLFWQHFTADLQAEDEFSLEILDAVTFPMAYMLIHLLAFDALVERVVFVGGMVHSLGEHYRSSLIRQLKALGLYQLSDLDDEFFENRISLGILDDRSSLLGAAYYALEYSPGGAR